MTRLVPSVPRTLFLSTFLFSAAWGCGSELNAGEDFGTGGADAGIGGGSGGEVAGSGGLSAGSGGTLPSGGAPSGGQPAVGGAFGAGGAISAGGAAASGGATGSGGETASGGADGTGGIDGGSGGAASGGSSNSGGTLHVFMLMGQSNMAGVAKRQPSDNNSDDRFKVFGGCNYKAGEWSTVVTPPLNECPGEKGWNLSDTVDPGMWFGKTLLPKIPAGDTIGVVGTAESGESINTFISGGSHHQMILNKIAGAKKTPNARFAGIIFHQGESDNTQASWPGKVVQLYNEVKAAWGVDYDVPMILGELPAGGCCSAHNTRVHEAADQLPKGYWISQSGTKVMDEYHFDHDSVVLMGTRYGEKMIEALGW